jgi:hypothetical protein
MRASEACFKGIGIAMTFSPKSGRIGTDGFRRAKIEYMLVRSVRRTK